MPHNNFRKFSIFSAISLGLYAVRQSFRTPKTYDLTAKISEKTTSFPGDPIFTMEHVCSLSKGDMFDLKHFHLGNHTGTHIDFPAHVVKGGKTSSDYPIEHLIGSALIIEVPETEKSISAEFIDSNPIRNNHIVFFKTSNSSLSKQSSFSKNYIYLEPNAADKLIKKGVKIVGIDYLSVDKYEAEDLPAHRKLLSNEVLIVENLELENVPTGLCRVFIMPLNVPGMDGLPARVIMQK